MNSLELFLNTLLWEKMPKLPINFRKFLLKVAPWSAIIFAISGVLGIITLIGFFGVGTQLVVGIAPLIGNEAAYGFFTSTAPGLFIGIIILAAETLFYFFAIPGLLAKKHAGWRWLFYALLAALVYEIISKSFSSALISILELYLLFQIRDFYLSTIEAPEETVLHSAPSSPHEFSQSE